jgi:hypothetical protein
VCRRNEIIPWLIFLISASMTTTMDVVDGLLNLALDPRQSDVEGGLLLPLVAHSAL